MRQLLLTLALLAAPSLSHAFYTVIDTGEVIAVGDYRAYLLPQIIMGDGGINFVGHFDTGLTDSTSARLSMGVGETDFHASAHYKWVPIPDYEGQPAIGVRGGITLGRDGDATITAAKIDPIISKMYDRPEGLIIPYASLPLGIASYDGESQYPVQLVLGTEWKPEQLRNVRFGGELGFEISDSFSYLALFATIDIDGARGLVFE